MAYDEKLAERIRSELSGLPFVEKKMFGGIAFLLHGNMACGAREDVVMVRVDPEKYDDLVKKPHARPFDLTGKPMKGWLVVAEPGYNSDRQLAEWVREGVQFALTLPPK